MFAICVEIAGGLQAQRKAICEAVSVSCSISPLRGVVLREYGDGVNHDPIFRSRTQFSHEAKESIAFAVAMNSVVSVPIVSMSM